MKLSKKLMLVIVIPLVVVFAAIVFLTEVVVKNNFRNNAYSYTDLVAKDAKTDIEAKLNAHLLILNTLSGDLVSLYKEGVLTREIAIGLLEDALERSDAFGAGIYMDPDILGNDVYYADSPMHDETGQFHPYFYRQDGEILPDSLLMEQGGDEWYDIPKATGKGMIGAPYVMEGVKIMGASMPLIVDGKFLGIVMVDVNMDIIRRDVAAIKPYRTGFTHLMDNNGIILASEFDGELDLTVVEAGFMASETAQRVENAAFNGESIRFSWLDTLSSQDVYSVVMPIDINMLEQNWNIMISVYKSDAFREVGLPEVRFYSWLTLGFIVFVMIGIVIFLRHFVLRNMNKFLNAFRDVTEGDGDLTKTLEIDSKDELGTLAAYLNKFLGSLHLIIVSLQKASNSSIQSTHEMSSAADELEEAFCAQTYDVVSVAHAMEEMTVGAGEVNSIIVDNHNLVQESVDKIKDGQASLNDVRSSIETIREKTVSLFETVEGLSDSSQQIGRILKIINDIADQTNLLALNAAIEAARAGDAGRGFAVVADEVRKLAERTQDATGDIHVIVGQLRNGTLKASREMQETGSTVEEGVQKTLEASTVFEEIVSAVKAIEHNSINIQQVVKNQERAITNVNTSAQSISSGIAQSSAAVSSFNKSVTQIANEAKETGIILSAFKVK